MGRRGPAPKNEHLKGLQGTTRGDRARHAPEYATSEPPMPEGLTDLAREEWDRVVPELLEAGCLTEVDRAVLTGYVTTWAEWRKLEEDIEKHGVYQTTESGYQQVRPAVTARDKARKACHEFARELGMSPSSRGRISIPKKKTTEKTGIIGLVKTAG